MLNTDSIWLFAGFRFHSCLLEALQKADSASSSHPSSCSADAAEGSVSSALKSDRTDISAVSDQDCPSSPVDTPVACEQAMDSTDTLNLCEIFEQI